MKINQKQGEYNTVVDLKTITGGRGDSGNWLLDLPMNTVFLTEQAGNLDPRMPRSAVRFMWKKMDQTEAGSVLLLDGYKWMNHSVRELHYWNPQIFVSQHRHIENIAVDRTEFTYDEDEEDHSDHRAGQGPDRDSPGGLGDDGQLPG